MATAGERSGSTLSERLWVDFFPVDRSLPAAVTLLFCGLSVRVSSTAGLLLLPGLGSELQPPPPFLPPRPAGGEELSPHKVSSILRRVRGQPGPSGLPVLQVSSEPAWLQLQRFGRGGSFGVGRFWSECVWDALGRSFFEVNWATMGPEPGLSRFVPL